MNEQIKINWYRCKVDRKLMSELMKTSDFRGFMQAVPQLLLFFTTGMLAYLAYLNVHPDNWQWSLPLMFLALFIHGTFSCFMGMAAPVHELCHKTPFRTKAYNEFFLKVFSFFAWTDYIGFRASHVKHHQVTTYHDHDGEVVLPQKLNWQSVMFFFNIFVCSPLGIYRHLSHCFITALGGKADWIFKKEWMDKVIPDSNVELRRARQRWAQFLILGHLTLATIFIVTGHWFLIIVYDLGIFYCGWLTMLCGTPQHIGMTPDTPDFRLCCRTYTCGWLPSFLYWNMQYHAEHHMFPAVPFYNLPKLRKAIEHDMPPCTHGLYATWVHILEVVRRQREDPTYTFVPVLPNNNAGERATDETLELEAAQRA